MTRFTKVEEKQEKQEDEEEGILDYSFSHCVFLIFFPFGNTKEMATFALLVVNRLWPRGQEMQSQGHSSLETENGDG
jgi:hypothetical protein